MVFYESHLHPTTSRIRVIEDGDHVGAYGFEWVFAVTAGDQITFVQCRFSSFARQLEHSFSERASQQ